MEMLKQRVLELSAPLTPAAASAEPRLNRFPDARVVLFDIYGTLLIAGSGDVGTVISRDNRGALLEALLAMDVEGDAEAIASAGAQALVETIRRAHARREKEGCPYPEIDIRDIWNEVFTALFKDGLLTRAFHALEIERLAMEYECRINPVWPMPGGRQAVEAVRRLGLRPGIVSNAQFYTPIILEALWNEPLVDTGIAPEYCAWSYRLLEAKPSPRLFRQILDVLARETDLPPEACVYIGNDMLNDVWTARACGCRTVLFAGDRRSLKWRRDDERTRDLQPDAVMTDWKQLPDILSD